MMIKKAVIVAAGKSSRLYPRTIDCPKGLLTINDREILKYSIDALKSVGVQEIAMVVGYKSDLFPKALGEEINYIYNPFFEHCNNMGSLWFAKEFIGNDPIFYLHSDLMYDPQILKDTLQIYEKNQNSMQLVVDFKKTDEEAMKVRITKDNFLIESNKEISLKESAGEWTGIAIIKDTRETLEYFEECFKNDGLNFYDSFSFTKMCNDGYKILCSPVGENLNWIEIDFESDFQKAMAEF